MMSDQYLHMCEAVSDSSKIANRAGLCCGTQDDGINDEESVLCDVGRCWKMKII